MKALHPIDLTSLKHMLFKIISLSMILTAPVFASLLTDSNIVFDWAEKEYPSDFATPHTITDTTITSDWYYRYYPTSKTYVGVERATGDVYVMGGGFGSTPLKVGPLKKYLDMICVTISFPVPGITHTYRITEKEQFYDQQIVENTYESFTTSSSRLKSRTTIVAGDFTAHINSEFNQFYGIADHYQYLIVSEAKSQSEPTTEHPFGESIFLHADYFPSVLQGPIGQYCKYQHWETEASTLSTTIIRNSHFDEAESDTEDLTALSGEILSLQPDSVTLKKDTAEEGYEIIVLSKREGIPLSTTEYNAAGEMISTTLRIK